MTAGRLDASAPGLAGAEIERLMQAHPKGVDLALDRIRALLETLGGPQRRLPPTIHVAGTNGKGSTIAFARAILEAEGQAVHVHTSPHLVSWAERYRLGESGGRGRFVSDAVLAEAVGRASAANGERPITVFEILTAVTFLLFSEHPADACLLEVGLGGRFDATNVVEKPAVTLVSSISLDHQSYLGDRVELIAAEKAGIFKRGVPAVIGQQSETVALDVLKSHATRTGIAPKVFGQDFLAFAENGRLVYQDDDGLLDLPMPRLAGRHQSANAALAIAGLKAGGFVPSPQAIETGIQTADWPGRLQRLTSGPLAAAVPGAEIWIDGGHNPGAGVVVAEAIAEMEDRVSRPLYLVCGMLSTKDPVGFFAAFSGMARGVLTVPLAASDMGIAPAELARSAGLAGLPAEPFADVAAALRAIAAQGADGEPGPRILICGSLYLVGEVLEASGLAPI